MFNSALLAGFFWATTYFTPISTIGAPPIVANILTTPSAAITAKQPVLMASVPTHTLLPFAPLDLEMPIPQARPLPPPAATDDAQEESQEFIERINDARATQGLSTLTTDPMLQQTARSHSEEMCTREYFDHHSPTPGQETPMDRYLTSMRESGISQPHYLMVGENIYYCSVFNDIYNVDYAHRALMNSPGHRANILEPRFTKIGLGIYHSAGGGFWVTEMFCRDTNP